MTYETLEQEIHAVSKALCYYRKNRLQIAKYTDRYGEVKHLLEFIKIEKERYISICQLSDKFVEFLKKHKHFKLKRNRDKNREEVISTSNVVTDDEMVNILTSCIRSIVIDEVLVDLAHG